MNFESPENDEDRTMYGEDRQQERVYNKALYFYNPLVYLASYRNSRYLLCV